MRKIWKEYGKAIVPCIIYLAAVLAVIGASVWGRESMPDTPTSGAGREKTRRIATETTEAVEDTTEAKTDTESATETDIGEWLTVTETESETVAEVEAPSEVAEFSDYCPLPLDHDAVLREVCEASGVPYAIAMALIYTESRFNPYAVSAAGCFGYCQLHPAYFAYCSPEDNIRAGIGWLGELIEEYGDIGTALTVYAIGHDNGSRVYASIIFARAREWGYVG